MTPNTPWKYHLQNQTVARNQIASAAWRERKSLQEPASIFWRLVGVGICIASGAAVFVAILRALGLMEL